MKSNKSLKNEYRFRIFKKVIKSKFPKLTQKISFEQISTILILQIKGSDVHPNVRHPDFFYSRNHPKVISGKKSIGQPINKKTQIDITAPIDLPVEESPVTSLVTPGPRTAIHHPIKLFHPIKNKWMTKNMKIQPKVHKVKGPAPDQARLLIGGTDPNSWSSELWANMGHYELDKWGHIIFVRSGSKTPFCFSIPRNILIEELLLDGGIRRGPSIRFRNIVGSPVKKSLVIIGPKPADQTLSVEFMYIVTNPNSDGWVKIGKTKQDPKSRLRGYNQGPVKFDMNHIFTTSNCNESENQVKSRLDQLGVNKEGNEWYYLGSLEPAISVIKEVVKLYPSPIEIQPSPIILSDESWAY